MTISSPDFEEHGYIPSKYTCDGLDKSPEIHIAYVPDTAKCLVLIMFDPDAPSGRFVHWLVWNIDAKTKIIKSDKLPDGSVEGTTSFQKMGYGGPCPPAGKTHRYYFKVYALIGFIKLPPSSGVNELEDILSRNSIASAEYIGIYKRESVLY